MPKSPRSSRIELAGALLGGLGAAAVAIGLFTTGPASAAYIGESFARIPGIGGSGQGEFRGWLRIEGHYWADPPGGGPGRGFGRGAMMFNGPVAPQAGASQLVIAVPKQSPGLARLMALCKSRQALPELNFAESAASQRSPFERGPVPANVPDFYRYRLKNVVIDGCGVDPAAPDQALILKFDNIEWLNYKPGPVPNPLPTAQLVPLDPGGDSMTFVVNWLAIAGDVSDDQCSAMNEKPPQDEFYRLLDPAAATKERAANDAKGGVSLEDGDFEWRGPNRTNVARLPMIVRDPGLVTVASKVARGVDLDGNDGLGKPPAGICRHQNFVSDDGRKGIDNQLFRVEGCIKAYQGHKGFYQQYQNEQRRNAANTLLVQVSGIENLQNDNRVQVTIVHSRDHMAKSGDGQHILPHYTFRVADDPGLNYDAIRLNGRIENGVITTKPVRELRMQGGSEMIFHDGRLRLQITPEGTLKGVVAGYQDWRRVLMYAAASNQEQLYGLTVPGLYSALRREADGMKDPATGQCMGISSVFDIEGMRAFMSSAPSKFVMAKETRFGLAPETQLTTAGRAAR